MGFRMADSIEKKVMDVISKYSDVSRDSLSLSTTLEDSGLDSMGVVETLFDLEDFFAVTMPDSDDIQDRFNLGTIGDIVTELQRLMSEKEAVS